MIPPQETILYESNSTIISWLGAVVSIACTIFSLLLIAGELTSSKPIFGIWGWLILVLTFLVMAMFSTIFVYSIPRSKYKVVWNKNERLLKKIGKNVSQAMCSNSSHQITRNKNKYREGICWMLGSDRRSQRDNNCIIRLYWKYWKTDW